MERLGTSQYKLQNDQNQFNQLASYTASNLV